MDAWYPEWVSRHCDATGADAAAARALLSEPVYEVLVSNGRATPGELGEVTVRLLARHGTPKFANEHADAVGLELVRLREDRRRAALPPPAAAPGDAPPDCPACGGSGLATVPLPACVRVERAGGADVAFIVPHPEYRRVLTGAVLCDRPGCAAGEVVVARERHRADKKPRRPTLTQAERAAGGADLPALLREYERRQAARCRASGPPDSAWAALVDSLTRKGRASGNPPAGDPPF